ncbi:hypothetical protein IWW36_000549 [Coemansia brasiliensis]|uniref:Uncharacterized protein n=1 Tax=Coemansia brasiliensis TaxID=2650707 RepID=A0A9W8IHB2_9FUNG|nr:hypothetical protein IWW36_000549 [Coemansia brasiliensis]
MTRTWEDTIAGLENIDFDDSLDIAKGRLSCKPSYDKLDLESSRKAEVIRKAVDRACAAEVVVLGNDRALSSTVWQNAQSHDKWQSQVHGSHNKNKPSMVYLLGNTFIELTHEKKTVYGFGGGVTAKDKWWLRN